MEKLESLLNSIDNFFENLDFFEENKRVTYLNEIKKKLRHHSPFKNEPIDCVLWIHKDDIKANDYNPNKIAKPEMKLLEKSISEDGYTQPIVVWQEDKQYTVVDGFHRFKIGSDAKDISIRLNNHLPVSIINDDRIEKCERMASTIRHNRARGKHIILSMTDIVYELKKSGWSDDKICDKLGMDKDEILRLCQIKGLGDVFSDKEFSNSWDPILEDEFTIGDLVND
jgi:ParB-like chromosome segregation protein Spo0J